MNKLLHDESHMEAIEGELLPEGKPELPDELTDTQVLTYAQRHRRALVEKLTDTGPPSTKEDTELMLLALRDMDRSALGRMKVDVEREGVENDRAAQDIIREMTKHSPRGLRREPVEHRPDPVIDMSVVDAIYVPETELESEGLNENAAEFMARMDSLDQ